MQLRKPCQGVQEGFSAGTKTFITWRHQVSLQPSFLIGWSHHHAWASRSPIDYMSIWWVSSHGKGGNVCMERWIIARPSGARGLAHHQINSGNLVVLKSDQCSPSYIFDIWSSYCIPKLSFLCTIRLAGHLFFVKLLSFSRWTTFFTYRHSLPRSLPLKSKFCLAGSF